MATIIDSLFITLGLDTKPFKQSADEVDRNIRRTTETARRQAAEMAKAGDVAEMFYKKLRNGALSFFSVLIGGRTLLAFASSIVQSDAAVGYFAHTMGMATEQASMWQNAVKAMGGTAEDAQQSISSLNKEITGVNSGLKAPDTGFLTALARIDPNIGNPYTKTPDQLLRALSPGLTRLKNRGQEALGYQLGEQAGLTDPMIRLLMQGPRGLDQALTRGKGTATTEDDAKRAQDFLNKLQTIEQQMAVIGRDLLEPLLPSITQFLDKIEKFIKANEPFIKGEITAALKLVGDTLEKLNLKEVWGDIDKIVTSMGGWKAAFEVLLGVLVAEKIAPLVGILTMFTSGASGVTAFGAALIGVLGTLGTIAAIGGGAGIAALIERYYGPDAELLPSAAQQVEMAGLSAQSHLGLGGAGGVAPPQGPVADRVREGMDILMKEGGFTEPAAAGIMGNFLNESKTLNPQEPGDDGQAIGIAQMHPATRAAAEAHFQKQLKDMTYPEQVRAVLWTIQNDPSYAKMMATLKGSASGDAGMASTVFLKGFEKPANVETHVMKRAADAYAAERVYGEPQIDYSKPKGGVRGGGKIAAPEPQGPPAPTQNVPAAKPAASVPAVQNVPPAAGPAHASIDVGTINIHTAATDAKGIARHIKGAIDNQLAQADMVLQSNRGLA